MLILIGCSKHPHNQIPPGTAITGCDGVTVIKAFQRKLSSTVVVDIVMRPEMKKSIYVLWSSVDSDFKRQVHKSRVKEGGTVSTEIQVSPGAEIIDISITGYKRIGT